MNDPQPIPRPLPDDLVPLTRIAGLLKISSKELVEASKDGRFCTVYEPIDRRYRVSLAEVEKHFGRCDVVTRKKLAKFRQDFVKARSLQRSNAHKLKNLRGKRVG
ncbi:MAG: hypothetical protein AAF196_02850 [Planctomycetota bacterium]